MKTTVNKWFEVKVKYGITGDDGKKVSVSESLLIDAVSWTEAESKTIKKYGKGNFCSDNINGIARSNVKETILSGDAERYFKAKICIKNVDEESGKEKKKNIIYLVQADDMENARMIMDGYINFNIDNAEISQLTETNIVDVIQHN